MRDWARRFRRLYYRFHAPGVPLVYHARYQTSVWGVPLDPLRGEKVLAALREAGLLRPEAVSQPRPASLENLLRVHTAEYLHSLQEGEALTRILGVEVPAHEAESTIELQRLMVGGTIHATRLALRTGGIAVHLGGGFHHALPDAGMGFCVFNDVAVAIRRLRARGYAERILVVDLDLHDGNGTRAVFASDPTVHTLSIHNDHWGDTRAVESTSLALGPSVEDAHYLEVLGDTLPATFAAFRPALVFYVAGTDPAGDDAMGNWRLTAQGLRQRDRLVTRLVREAERPLPLVVVLAGGYGPHAWRHTARLALALASGRELEPLDEEDLALRHARRVVHSLPPEPSQQAFDFALTEEDLGLVPGLAAPTRFLGHFSRHTLELLLERLGILAQIRAKGFRGLRVDVALNGGIGDTLRVLSEERGRELLVELRVSRTRRKIPGMELLVVEWLLLQNPRLPFSVRRPRLPGQQHPGLGLLKDMLGWLVALCEALGLDGVHFMAAHYHIAMQGRRLVRFLEPEDEARAHALTAALGDLTLAEAVRALEAQALRDAEGRPVSWEPAPMVLPVSEQLSALVNDPERESRVTAAAESFRFHREVA